MGLHEYRPPSAHGGITQAWMYRDDLRWLAEMAVETSQWLSARGRQVHYDAADVLHELITARKNQGHLPLKPPEGAWPIFWRGKAPMAKQPGKARPRAPSASSGH